MIQLMHPWMLDFPSGLAYLYSLIKGLYSLVGSRLPNDKLRGDYYLWMLNEEIAGQARNAERGYRL
ncbi:MAG: hypothetical protein PHI48_10990 [Bacteroidales bacterium]|nr:hypothetical protein [Bacteroidales bacterium]